MCANNHWAISTPGSVQTASPTIAIKGLGYGVESLRVDGNDVCAVYLASRYAADKARRGGGPTFLELLTYRVSAHSSSDDPSRYRDEPDRRWRSKRDRGRWRRWRRNAAGTRGETNALAGARAGAPGVAEPEAIGMRR